MGILQKLLGRDGASIAEVDTNFSLQVRGPADKTKAGYLSAQFEADAGAITGAPTLRAPFVSAEHKMAVGLDTNSAIYNFVAGTQNTGKFKHAFTTMTMTQSGGFLNINPALATGSGNYAYLQSWKHFPLQGDAALHIGIIGQLTGMPPTNQIFEAGLFLGTAGVVPADGIFFRVTASGVIGVISYAGVETPTGILAASVPANTNKVWKILVNHEEASFWVDGALAATIPTPSANAIPYLTMNLPLCFMMRNSGAVTGGATVKIGTAHVLFNDVATNKSWAEQMAIQGGAYQGQDGDAAQGSLAAYSNSALSAAAALSNTTAAAPNTGLGGVVLVLPTLAAGTDGILFAYQNPTGSTTQPPKTLVVKGVAFDASVQVVLVGGPLSLVMGVAFGSTAVSLATPETGSFVTGTTKAPRRVPLGILSFVAAAAAGTGVTIAPVKFESPIVVNPGEWFVLTCRNVGVVTTSGALVMSAFVDSYFE